MSLAAVQARLARITERQRSRHPWHQPAAPRVYRPRPCRICTRRHAERPCPNVGDHAVWTNGSEHWIATSAEQCITLEFIAVGDIGADATPASGWTKIDSLAVLRFRVGALWVEAPAERWTAVNPIGLLAFYEGDVPERARAP